jgi:hypothetical protein
MWENWKRDAFYDAVFFLFLFLLVVREVMGLRRLELDYLP